MQKVRQAVLDWHNETKGYNSTEDAISRFEQAYNCSREDAIEEYTNEALSGLFSTDEGVKDFLSWLEEDSGYSKKEKKTVIQKIVELFDRLVEAIKNTISSGQLSFAAKDFAQMQADRAAKIRKMFLDALDGTSEQSARMSGEVKNSIAPDFEKKYDNWDKKNSAISFRVGTTSSVLRKLGVDIKNIYWDSSKIIKIKKDHPLMTDDVIKQVPQILENPILVMRSLTNSSRMTLLGEVYDSNGTSVLAVLELNAKDRKGTSINVIKIASAYGKDSNLQGFINRSQILYIDPNKERTRSWFVVNRLQLPLLSTNYGFVDSSLSQNQFAVNNSAQNDVVNTKNSLNSEDNPDIRYSLKGISRDEVDNLQNIGKKSVNQFTQEDIKTTEDFAKLYYKELGTKSPFFRSWFGDWREYDTTPIVVAKVNGAERGKIVNTDTGWKINVSGKVFNETKAHKAAYNRAAVDFLPYIDDIVKNAVLLDSFTIDKAKSSNSLFMHSFYAVADIGNGREVLKLYVEEMNDPNQTDTAKRAYQLQHIEKYQQSDAKGSGKFPSPVIQTTDINTVSDLFSYVKQKDSNFKPNRANTVLLNEDGTPKVFFHSTNADFTVFKQGNGILGKGIYFSDYSQGIYGKNIIQAYLTAKNPVRFSDLPKGAREINSSGYETRVIDDFFEKFPQYDAIVSRDEIVVKNSAQIKSATDNVGTFSKDNPDIRYSLKGISRDEVDKGKEKRHNKKRLYNEADTLFMQWSNSPSVPVGERKIFKRGSDWVWFKKAEDGCIELFRNKSKEVVREYERTYSEANNEIYGNSESVRSDQGRDIWNMLIPRNRGNDDRNVGQAGSEGLQVDAEGDREHLRSGVRGISDVTDTKSSLRHSLGIADNNADSSLLSQLEEQKKLVSHLQGLLGMRHFVDMKQVRTLAGVIKKDYNSTIGTNELVDMLGSFYESVATSRELSWDVVESKTKEIAEAVVSKSKNITEITERSKEILADIRSVAVKNKSPEGCHLRHTFGLFVMVEMAVIEASLRTPQSGLSHYMSLLLRKRRTVRFRLPRKNKSPEGCHLRHTFGLFVMVEHSAQRTNTSPSSASLTSDSVIVLLSELKL